MTDSNLTPFATALAGIPKAQRKGPHQSGSDGTMLIHHADDQTRFVGRLTKKGKERYIFETFDGTYTAEEVQDAKVIAEGRSKTPLRAINLVRKFNAAHKAE